MVGYFRILRWEFFSTALHLAHDLVNGYRWGTFIYILVLHGKFHDFLFRKGAGLLIGHILICRGIVFSKFLGV